MNKTLFKIASIISILILAVSLSACGKKDDESVSEGDGYEYYATFEKINIDKKAGYISSIKLDGDNFYAVATEFEDGNYENAKTVLHKYNVLTKNDEKIELEVPKEAYIQNMIVSEDGSLLLLEQQYSEDYMETTYTLIKLDQSGKEVSKTDLSSVMPSDSYMYNMMVAKDGTLYFALENAIVAANADGSVICNIPLESWPEGLFEDANGNVYVCSRRESDWTLVARKVNTQTKALEDGFENLGRNGTVYNAANGNLLVADSESVEKYNTATSEKEHLWNWIDLDTSEYSNDQIYEKEDGSFVTVIRSWRNEEEKIELVTIAKREKSSSEKTVVNYGCMYMNYDLKEKIIDFNKSNPDVRINVKAYETDNYEEYEANLNKLKMDFLDGKLDIVSVYDIGVAELVKNKALADLDSFFDKDSTLNKEDFFTSAIDAGRVDGKLYSLNTGFSLQTLAMPKSKASEISGEWDFDSLLKLREKYKDTSFLEYSNKDFAFSTLFYAAMNKFVDFENAKCNFNSDEFKAMLEFANTFPKEPQEVDNSWKDIQDGKVILLSMYFNSLEEADLYTQLLGEDLVYVGYPGVGGNGSLITSYSAMGISEKSKHKDEAWTFMSSLLSEESQMGDYYSYLPVRKSAFYDMMEKAKRKTIKDENGNESFESHGGWGNGDVMVELYGITDEQAKVIEETIEGAVASSAVYDDKIYEIINEEIQPFFAGQKSADEVGSLIQNRVSLYLAENS